MTRSNASGPAAPVSATAMLLTAARTLGRLVKVLNNRREVNSLREVDDRILKDIGLTRADVEGAMSVPLYQDPSSLLIEQAAGRGRPVTTRSPVRGRHDAAPAGPVALQECT